MQEALFPGFRRERFAVEDTEIHAVVGGSGPPVLLLHGYPQTHVCWHRVAPALAAAFTVVCPDLRGYGESGRPTEDPEHRAYSKRVMAADQLAVMGRLGFTRFAVAGHDRGGRVAYRMALDHPHRVTRLAVLDIIPTIETWMRLDREQALAAYHWLFLAQPHDLPERLIGADPEYFLTWTLRSWAAPGARFDARALADYLRAFRDPATIRATCADYRAGASVDVQDDAADRGVRRVGCPLLVLWGAATSGHDTEDAVTVWRGWADDVRGQGLPCGHFLPEEAPVETARALAEFFAG